MRDMAYLQVIPGGYDAIVNEIAVSSGLRHIERST